MKYVNSVLDYKKRIVDRIKVTILLVIGMFLLSSLLTTSIAGAASVQNAGWRSSDYGYQQEAAPSYWIDVSNKMASKFPGSQPAGIWILGTDWGDGVAGLNFPRPPGSGSYPNIEFADTDMSEKYLKAFDKAGLKVWLQVEPSSANVNQLIDLVLGRYGHHPSVMGFGIDVEWLESKDHPEGRPVTNTEAARWLAKVKSYNSSYKLFLKHWDPTFMPTKYYQDIVFISDSMDFKDLNAMLDDFKYWANSFPKSKVGYQIGYNIDTDDDGRDDRDWWKPMKDPAKEIGNAITSKIPNVEGIYWVDFSITEVFPPTNTITFVVSSNNKLVSNASVIMDENIKVRTDTSGKAVFKKVTSGNHKYKVVKSGYNQAAGTINVTGNKVIQVNISKTSS